MIRSDVSVWRHELGYCGYSDVNTPEQKAGISLNKTRVCCKLKNVVKLRFYSASPYCPVSKWYLRRYKFVAAYCDRPGASRVTFLILLFSRWCYVLQALDMGGSWLEQLKSGKQGVLSSIGTSKSRHRRERDLLCWSTVEPPSAPTSLQRPPIQNTKTDPV